MTGSVPSLLGERRGGSRAVFRQRLLVVFAVVLILPYARQIGSSPTVGQDFRAFFAASTVIAEHGNPYDWGTLSATEDRLYNRPGALHPGAAAYYDFLPYPEGPWLAFALVPLSGLAWPLAYAMYAAVLVLLLVLGSYAMFRALGWPLRRSWVAATCTLLSAVGFINVFMGQASVVVFAALIGAWLMARRGHPVQAGILLALLWIKPNIGLPLAIVVALLEPRGVLRLFGGFAATTIAMFAVAAAVLGRGFLEWPAQSQHMWQSVQGVQPDIASVESFFYPGLSGWMKTVALAITLAAAIAYGIWLTRRAPDRPARGLTVLLVWMAALPFVQSYDLILLVPLIAVLLARNLDGWNNRLTELAVWSFMTVPLLYFVGLRFGYFNGFSAIPVVILLIAWHRHIVGRPDATRGEDSRSGVLAA